MPKIYPQFTDPIGPGTQAWNAFDEALEAYGRWFNNHTPSDSNHHPDYKRYSNQRDAMIMHLRRHNAPDTTIAAWLTLLRDRIRNRQFGEY